MEQLFTTGETLSKFTLALMTVLFAKTSTIGPNCTPIDSIFVPLIPEL
jgi:hypothetical protein